MKKESYFVIDRPNNCITEVRTVKEVEVVLWTIFQNGFNQAIQDINSEELLIIKGKKCKIIDYDISIEEE